MTKYPSSSSWALIPMRRSCRRPSTFARARISCEMTVASAHRSPERVMRLVREAPGARREGLHRRRRRRRAPGRRRRGAHDRAGHRRANRFVGAQGTRRAALDRADAAGCAVATVSIGKPGATNAGVLAAQILALGDPAIATRLERYKKKLAEKVEQAAARLPNVATRSYRADRISSRCRVTTASRRDGRDGTKREG